MSGCGIGQRARLIGESAQALHHRRSFHAEFADDVLGEGEHAGDIARAPNEVFGNFVDDWSNFELRIRRLALHLDDAGAAQAFEDDVRGAVLEFDVADDASDAREGAGRFVVVRREAFFIQLRDREHAAAGEGLLQHLAVARLEDAQRHELLRQEDAVTQGHDRNNDGGNHGADYGRITPEGKRWSG